MRPPVSLIFFCCSDGQGSSYVWDLLGVGAFRLAFCCWRSGFSVAGGRVARVPTWILVCTLGAVDRELLGSFIFVLTPLARAAAWLGAGGEVGESNGMIAVAISCVQWHYVVPGMFRRGQGSCGTLASVAGALGRDGLVLRCSSLG